MPNLDSLIDEWSSNDDQIKKLKARQDEVAKQLLEKMQVGEVKESSNTGNKVRKCVRKALQPEKLEVKLTKQKWTTITKRVPVAALIKAQILKGSLTQELIDSCSIDTTPWLEKR